MATSNHELIELLRGMLYDRGPQANGEISARAARAVAEHDIDASDYTVVSLNSRELASILAGLRLLQQTVILKGNIAETLHDAGEPLDDDEIDTLCERLNGGEG